MDLHRLLYISFAPKGFDADRNVAILKTARERNARMGVTGLLLCKDMVYAQVLEGPRDAVDAVFAAIARDPRHQGVTVMARRDVDRRLFPEWQMGFYHMSAVEGMFGSALLRNDDAEITLRLKRHAPTDTIAGSIADFLAVNASAIRPTAGVAVS